MAKLKNHRSVQIRVSVALGQHRVREMLIRHPRSETLDSSTFPRAVEGCQKDGNRSAAPPGSRQGRSSSPGLPRCPAGIPTLPPKGLTGVLSHMAGETRCTNSIVGPVSLLGRGKRMERSASGWASVHS